MEGLRSPQETAALRDVAFTIRFGHAPCDPAGEERDGKDGRGGRNHREGRHGRLETLQQQYTTHTDTSDICQTQQEQILASGKQSDRGEDEESPNECKNPVQQSDQTAEDKSPFSEEDDPLNDDKNPFKEDDSLCPDKNPFGEDDCPSDDDKNPFKDENNSSGGEKNLIEEGNHIVGGMEPPSGVKENPSAEAEQCPSLKSPQCPSPTPLSKVILNVSKPNQQHSSTLLSQGIPPSTPSTPRSETPSPSSSPSPSTTGVSSVTKAQIEELISRAFNITLLDLRRLVEDMAREKTEVVAQLRLTEIRTEGLVVTQYSGASSPPVALVRATLGGESAFTTFSSPSATNANPATLTLPVSNMYTQMLTLQIWIAMEPLIPESQSGQVLDILGRLINTSIKGRKEKDTAARANGSSSSSTAKNTEKKLPASDMVAEDAERTPVKASEGGTDEPDHSDDTPIINVSLWDDKNKQRATGEELQDENTLDNHNSTTNSPSLKAGTEEVHQNTEDIMEDDVSVTSERSSEQTKTSTPRGRSASLQQLELSSVNYDSQDDLDRKSSRRSSLKMKAMNIGQSLRSSFRRGHNNGRSPSPKLQNRSPDNQSVDSGSSDGATNTLTENGTDGAKPSPDVHQSKCIENGGASTNKQKSEEKKKNTLNREKSSSSLSLASLTRRTRSLRLSSQKATDVFRRIGSLREKGRKKEMSSTETLNESVYVGEPDNMSIASVQSECNIIAEDKDNGSVVVEDGSHTDEMQVKQDRSVSLPGTPKYFKNFSSRFKTQRTMRVFKSLKDKKIAMKKLSETTDELDGVVPVEEEKKVSSPEVDPEIQSYLSSIGKGHLNAEILAHVDIPLKDLIGTWAKECWYPLTLNSPRIEETSPKKRKSSKGHDTCKSGVTSPAKSCKLHLHLSLPSPQSELGANAYDSYNTTYRKLVDAFFEDQTVNLKEYRGGVGAVGKVLLEQLVFFSRASQAHQNLALWLVLVCVKPSDANLLLPLLRSIRASLEATHYATAQKRQLGASLAQWVQIVLADEFEKLHLAFPSTSHLTEIPRLENFLRCFSIIEECYEMRILFEREMANQDHTNVTDLLQEALEKHTESWIEALNKEPLDKSESDESSLIIEESLPGWTEWQGNLRRASILTKPVLDFLYISVHTYQPIFMIELSLDYMHFVLPRMVTAALELVKPLSNFEVEDNQRTGYLQEALPTAAQAAWRLCANLSDINKIGINCVLPQHLIPQDYCHAFSSCLLQWLALSKQLALEELDRDLQQDDFVAVEEQEGYSQSAIGVADLLRALMVRVSSVKWPGGVRPGGPIVTKIARQILQLVTEYTNRVTHTHNARGGQVDRISTEVCVVVRNVERVCDEARKHLDQLSLMVGSDFRIEEGDEVRLVGDVTDKQEEDRQPPETCSEHLQKHIDFTAEVLLQRCLPRLEHMLYQAVSKDDSEHLRKVLENALQPVEDRLYFAEPLLHQLWTRLFIYSKQLMKNYIQGEWRDSLRRLREVLKATYTFLTDRQGVGLQLTDEANTEYEKQQERLKILGATSPELIARYYHERLKEQAKETPGTAQLIIINTAFTEGGLRVHVIQGPGAKRGALVKVRIEPQEWFPTAEPQKTHLIKEDPAVFNQIITFPETEDDYHDSEVGGVLVLQVRTPKLLGNSIVHGEAIIPLADIPRTKQDSLQMVQHSRFALTRPWKLSNYESLEALRTRALDKVAVDFLKALSERWEPKESSVQINESQKLRATFARAGSIRNNVKSSRRPLLREGPTKS